MNYCLLLKLLVTGALALRASKIFCNFVVEDAILFVGKVFASVVTITFAQITEQLSRF
jgi:hypothetical protein